MTEEAFAESVRSMRNRESCLERAGDYWSDEERERLKEMFYAGTGISEMAIRLQRTEPAVLQQAEKMDLYQRKTRPTRRKSSGKDCSCHCPTCEVDEQCCPRHIEEQQARGTEDA